MIANGAFARAREMFSRIASAMGLPTAAEQRAALAGILPYKSRGKGEGCPGNKHSKHTVAMDKRAARKARNKRRV